MKRFAFAIAALAMGIVGSTSGHADFTIVQFQDGWCKIWWDSASTPWGVGWTKIVLGLPDWQVASAALYSARLQGVCR
jgi:hypothetical protein